MLDLILAPTCLSPAFNLKKKYAKTYFLTNTDNFLKGIILYPSIPLIMTLRLCVDDLFILEQIKLI